MGAEHLFGYTAAEAVGQPVTMLIPEDHLDEEPEILARVKRGEVVDHYETVRRRKDRTLLDISLTVSPIRDASGAITGASKVALIVLATRLKTAGFQLLDTQWTTPHLAQFGAISIPRREYLQRLQSAIRTNPHGTLE
jgi:hypothetical protein